MDLTQLQYFRMTAQMGSVSRAAATLFVTQSTLSKSITALERSLGTKLFDRVGNSIQLNESGRVFLEYAEKILDLSYEAAQAMLGADNPETGTVIYSVPSGGILSDLEADFLERHPNIHLKQRLLNTEQALAALQKRELDYAFSFQPIRGPGIDWRPLCRVRFVATMSQDNPLAKNAHIPLSALQGQKFFANNINSDNYQLFTRLIIRAGFVPDIIYEGDDLLLSMRFITRNGAVSVNADFNYCDALESQIYVNNRICAVPISDEWAKTDFGVARLQGRYINRTAAAFYEYIAAAVSARADAEAEDRRGDTAAPCS